MTEKLWYNDLRGFITEDNFLKFFPTSNMTFNEKINSIVRFTIYLVLILVLFKNNYQVFYILVIVLLLTYAMTLMKDGENQKIKEQFRKKNLVNSKSEKK